MRDYSATIVTVSFRSKALIDFNYQLASKLNPNIKKLSWIVVQNTPADIDDITDNDQRFRVLSGSRITELERRQVPAGSFAHGRALNLALHQDTSDYFIVIDPDCFVLQTNWLEKTIAHMEEHELCFFGAPYHPNRLWKGRVFTSSYNNFPNAILLFINRRLLNSKFRFALDFMPDFEGSFFDKPNWEERNALLRNIPRARLPIELPRALLRSGHSRSALLKHFFWRISGKWMVEWRRDVGYALYERYRKDGSFECLTPYVGTPPSLCTSLLKWLVPPHRINHPNRHTKWNCQPFSFVPPQHLAQWEQFYWDTEPYAVHLGAGTIRSVEQELADLKLALRSFEDI